MIQQAGMVVFGLVKDLASRKSDVWAHRMGKMLSV